MGYVVGEDGLAVQDAVTLDASTLTPLSPEVISRQATINIGASAVSHTARCNRKGLRAARSAPPRSPLKTRYAKKNRPCVSLGAAAADAAAAAAASTAGGRRRGDGMHADQPRAMRHGSATTAVRDAAAAPIGCAKREHRGLGLRGRRAA